MVQIKWEDRYGTCNANYNMSIEDASQLWEETHTDIRSYVINKQQYINSRYKEE